MARSKEDSRIREQVDRLGRPTVEMLDREIARLEKQTSYKKLLRGFLSTLLIAIAVIILVANLWLTVLQVDGSSMHPLLEMNEIVLAVKTDDPVQNDIIAFYHENKLYVKRVIATADDWVNINGDGIVSINGNILDEPYVAEPSIGTCDINFPFLVPPGTVFVLGDNRPVSLDSRRAGFGPVNKDRIDGRVIFRIWPLSKFGSVK
ncbi:MAG: signal peptidase I [Oscillospiraceae bacterium]|nr:signal peptidase I [Oscillospiraceae bacterium]